MRGVTMQLALDKMSIKEKLKLIDDIWSDLLEHEDTIPSPTWHGEVLCQREKALELGQEKISDWEKAKRDILKTVHED